MIYFGKGDPNIPIVDPAANHELEEWIEQTSRELKAEYGRIRRRATEDPGTAGDEGEENWRLLLKRWLPEQFPIVTKGRILGHDGKASPQVDVLALRPGYPLALQDKKMYLAGGVLAAFECKLTLKPPHVERAAATARIVRELAAPRTGSPYDELHSPIIFGLLAHEAEFRRAPESRIDSLLKQQLAKDSHPREVLDVLCVASLACWRSWALLMTPTSPAAAWEESRKLYDLDSVGSIHQTYARWMQLSWRGSNASPEPLYPLIGHLLRRLSSELAMYRPFADYWLAAQTSGHMGATVAGRSWPFTILSEPVRARIRAGRLTRGDKWDP